MISVLSLWTFWFYILLCYVHKTKTAGIFQNTMPPLPPSLITRFEPIVVSKTCLLIPEEGPCRSKIRMWYYSASTKNCSRFDWGGCQGNGNRFDSLEECRGYCLSKPGVNKYIPRYCALTFDYGFCFGAVERWYYDSLWKVCKTTIYSGCGGNKNNFYNLEQCESVCRFGHGALMAQRIKSGGTRKVVVINPWNTTPRRGGEQSSRGRGSNATTAGAGFAATTAVLGTAATPAG